MRRLVVGIAIVGALLGGACSSKEKNAGSDVSVGKCTSDPGGGKPTAEGAIHNNSSKDSGYAFRIEFKDGDGNKVSDGAVTVAKVEAGGDATWDATGATSVKGDVTCEVVGVTRTAVP